MQRAAVANHPHVLHAVAGPWLARRWYYTARSHRPYSVRQISPGDRRLLAEFALALNQSSPDRERACGRDLGDMLFDRVIAGGSDSSVGFAALEATAAGDRVIGVAAYAPAADEYANFSTAVVSTHREEQVGRILLSTLVRHAKRVGVQRLVGVMSWSNRPMRMLAMSMGFKVEPAPADRNLRRLVLSLK
ncbi:MAG: GNAT family N-acetyltransferase [Pseudomonadota bacterium]